MEIKSENNKVIPGEVFVNKQGLVPFFTAFFSRAIKKLASRSAKKIQDLHGQLVKKQY